MAESSAAMERKKSDFEQAKDHLAETLRWIPIVEDEMAENDVADRVQQLSEEIRRLYGLEEQPEEDKYNLFHKLTPPYRVKGIFQVDQDAWQYFADHHFEMILDVGRESADCIRKALMQSGIGRRPDKHRGIFTVKMYAIKTKPITACPPDMYHSRLGDIAAIPQREIENHFLLEGKRDRRFVDEIYKLLKRV